MTRLSLHQANPLTFSILLFPCVSPPNVSSSDQTASSGQPQSDGYRLLSLAGTLLRTNRLPVAGLACLPHLRIPAPHSFRDSSSRRRTHPFLFRRGSRWAYRRDGLCGCGPGIQLGFDLYNFAINRCSFRFKSLQSKFEQSLLNGHVRLPLM